MNNELFSSVRDLKVKFYIKNIPPFFWQSVNSYGVSHVDQILRYQVITKCSHPPSFKTDALCLYGSHNGPTSLAPIENRMYRANQNIQILVHHLI